MYTLSGKSNQIQGWGVEAETWHVKDALKEIGAPTWFQLGDKDIATHLYRNHLKQEGLSLTQVSQLLFESMGVDASIRILPMCNEAVSTFVECVDKALGEQGKLTFQEYFVGMQCQPEISRYGFSGIENSSLSPDIQQAVDNADAIIICPSNPFVSIEPILSIPGLKELILQRKAYGGLKILAVSPIINGSAVKGPAAKMMTELGLRVNNLSIAKFYQGLVDMLVIDESDRAEQGNIEELGFDVAVSQTLMKTFADKERLANEALRLIHNANEANA